MEYGLILNLIAVILIVGLLSLKIIKEKVYSLKCAFRFYLVTLFNFLFLLVILSWLLGYFSYSSNDLAYIFSFMLLINLISLSIFFPKANFQNWVFWTIYLLSFFILIIGNGSIFLVTSISFLDLLTLSANGFFLGVFRKTSIAGLIFSSVGIICQVILFFNKDLVIWTALLLNILFFIYLITLFKELSPKGFKENKKIVRSKLIDFLKYFIFIIIITNFVLIATLSLHELGHFTISSLYGCTGQKIVFESGSLHTYLLCNGAKNLPIILGGLIFPTIISLLLFFSVGKSLRGATMLILAFGLIASFKDLQEAGLSELLTLIIAVIGVILIFFGISSLIKERIDEHLAHLASEEEQMLKEAKHCF